MDTLFIGKNLLFLHEVDSTNTYAMNLLRNVNVMDGTVIYTDHQTQGKGQRGALWHSDTAKNVTTSIILKPTFLSPVQAFYLSKISALAVYDVLTDILPASQYDIKIKWPNDILVNRQKIAGILIENSFTVSSIQYSVIGIGLNVNQDEFDDLNNVERIATSLKLLLNKVIDCKEVLDLLCQKLEKWFLKLKENKLALIDNTYLDHLFGIHQVLSFKDATNMQFEGNIIGVNKEGQLMLELDDSKIKTFEIKEIKFLF